MHQLTGGEVTQLGRVDLVVKRCEFCEINYDKYVNVLKIIEYALDAVSRSK